MKVTSMHQVPGAGSAAGRPFLGSFESTYLPGHGLDVVQTTGHDRSWREDLD